MAVYMDMAVSQFENTNSLRKFPFSTNSSLVSSSGKELPLDVVVDVHMVVPADVDAPHGDNVTTSNVPETPIVRLSSVHISPSMVSVCFTSEITGSINALSVTVSRANFRPYTPYRMEKLHGSSDIGGIVTFGDMTFPVFPEIYRFVGESADNALVHPCCIAIAKPARLRKITDRRSGKSVSGDVKIGFSGYIDVVKQGKNIGLSLKSGAAEELISVCEDGGNGRDPCGATPIRSINGIIPDEDGNIVLWFH